MSEILISFETAKLAKEKGFDVPYMYAGNNMENNIKIKKENLLNAYENNPESRLMLQDLFPDVFGGQKIFCTENDIIVKKGGNSFYKIVSTKKNIVSIHNITYNTTWQFSICVKDYKGYITVDEFSKLLEPYSPTINNFVVVNKTLVSDIYNLVKLNS